MEPKFRPKEDLFDPTTAGRPRWTFSCVDCGANACVDADTFRCRPCWARAKDPCQAWADGKHQYEVQVHVTDIDPGDPRNQVKRCACGKTVERA